MNATEYASYYQAIAAKYQTIRPQVAKWASRLTLAQLSEEMKKHGAPHITDLIDIVSKKQTLA
jgi:hypothetical protein